MKNVKSIVLSAVLTSLLYQGSALAESEGHQPPRSCPTGKVWDPIREKCVTPVSSGNTMSPAEKTKISSL